MRKRRDFGVFLAPPGGGANAFGVDPDRAKALGVDRGDILLTGPMTLDRVDSFTQWLSAHGISVAAAHAEFHGQDYASRDVACRTIGLVDRLTLAERLFRLEDTAVFAQKIGARRVGFHPGQITGDNLDEMVAVCSQAANRIFDRTGLRVVYESGPVVEIVNTEFLRRLEVAGTVPWFNFDPRNLMGYKAVPHPEALVPYAQAVFGVIPADHYTMHGKDGLGGLSDGSAWDGNDERPIGEGHTPWDAILEVMDQAGCPCEIVIECETGTQVEKAAAMAAGIDYLRSLMQTA